MAAMARSGCGSRPAGLRPHAAVASGALHPQPWLPAIASGVRRLLVVGDAAVAKHGLGIDGRCGMMEGGIVVMPPVDVLNGQVGGLFMAARVVANAAVTQ